MPNCCTTFRPTASRAASWAAFIAIGHCLGVVPSSLCAENAIATIRLTIDYGDGVQKTFAALPWKEKMTVFESLQAAEKHSRGIKLAFLGRAETIFITAIDDAVNEGANGRNWRYTVNDQPAQYSAGVMELKAGDIVMWRFGK
jgi:hypothetical protein